jgi:very-short-patch-repair endonuclease
MSHALDERPLHELKDVWNTDRYREWSDLSREANGLVIEAEKLMKRWCAGKETTNPFVGRFPIEQLDRTWPFMAERINEILNQLYDEFGYTEKQYNYQLAEFEMMLRLMRDHARPGDVDPEVKAPAPRPTPIYKDQSESPIERALLRELRKSGLLGDRPDWIAKDCERAPGRSGIFIFQQAPVLYYRADFLLAAMASPEMEPHWVVAECDGHEFHERTPVQAEHDRKRDRTMTAAGYRVFRFTGTEINRDPAKCAAEVINYLRPYTEKRTSGGQPADSGKEDEEPK